jgi:hypothetical protein
MVCHWLHMHKSFNIMDFSKFQSFIASVWKAKHGSPSFLAIGCADGLHKGGEFHRAAGVVAVLPIGGIVAELVNGVCGSLKEKGMGLADGWLVGEVQLAFGITDFYDVLVSHWLFLGSDYIEGWEKSSYFCLSNQTL